MEIVNQQRAFGGTQYFCRHEDAAKLLKDSAYAGEILVDQGTEDKFLEQQLQPEILAAAALSTGRKITLRMQPGYDHSYYFISTFIADHLAFHAAQLACANR